MNVKFKGGVIGSALGQGSEVTEGTNLISVCAAAVFLPEGEMRRDLD